MTSISRATGGLFESVRHLSVGVAASEGNYQVDIVGTRDGYTHQDIPAWQPLAVRVHTIFGPKHFGYARGMLADLFVSAPDLVHLHGLWQYPSLAVLNWSRKIKRPYIVSPHGMLEPWALAQSRVLKKLAGWLYQNACLRGATVIWATSKMEGENVRRAGFNNPIALIPNGVELPAALEKPEIRNQKSAVRRALFLSRIHPKKGLLNLVKAWDAVQKSEARSQKPEVGIPASDFRSPASDKWELLIVGPDEGGHLAEVQAAVRNAGLERQIHFHGEVMGEDKIECYRGADLFVLPSFSENFGLVIAEALSCGVPVITTRETPWEELETHRFG